MTTINTSASDVSFRVRPLGFDKGEVQAFIGNLLNDYAQVTRELDRLRNEMATLREFSNERRPVAEAFAAAQAPAAAAPSIAASAAKEVERILAGAERIAEEIRSRASEEARTGLHDAETQAAATLGDADARATSMLRDADARATSVIRDADLRAAELLKEAETRAAEIVDGAVQQVVHLDRQAASVRAQCVQMRSAIKSATEAAAMALKEITAMEEDHDPEPALHTKRG